VRGPWVKVHGRAWRLAIPVVSLAAAAQLALAGQASASHAVASAGHAAGTIKPDKVNSLDCNGWSKAYTPANPAMRMFCTDPLSTKGGYGAHRFYDNGHYVGHDEPSVKFISAVPGSGNTMTYAMRLPKDPAAAPTPSGSVTDYEELSVAPWFGLPICDPNSYPQNPCTPDSDSNSGSISNPSAAGSAFMELQFYPPGWTPFTDAGSCSRTQYCAALNIDSLECTFGFAFCNSNCIEPVNFSYLQTNGVPPGPPAPQDPNAYTWLGNAKTLRMNPGDVVVVSITDPPGGLTATVRDLTTGQKGYIQASARNGFANTSLATCAGTPHTFHAEYSTARKQNQVPWAALEGGVLMEQEIGHFEACRSVANKDGYSASYSDGTSYQDPNVYENCAGGSEGAKSAGEGPCNLTTGICANATTQSATGPVACPNPDYLTSTDHCEFADGFCFPKGTRAVTINGHAATEFARLAGCYQDQFQNGDLDYDGTPYRRDWPNGSVSFPQTFEYVGPFSRGHAYAKIQFETDAPASEQLCDTSTGAGCQVPPAGAKFYPYWSVSNHEVIQGIAKTGACIWNFGNYDVKSVTKSAFGKDKQYGKPDVARYGGTTISGVRSNPTLAAGCAPVSIG
jgi:hypothetical protein